MKFRYINAVGVELEGNWSGERGIPPFEDVDIKHDGSVNHVSGFRHYGEIAGPPIDNWEALSEFIKVHNPHAADASCGYHIHVSLKRLVDYSRLMVKPFHTLVLKEFEKWAKAKPLDAEHPFWTRWKGDNSYCKKTFRPQAQLHDNTRGGARYTQLNFCWGLHKTLEFRMLPMFTDPSHTVEATEVFLTCIEDFLLACSKSKKKRNAFKADLVITGKDLNEEVPTKKTRKRRGVE